MALQLGDIAPTLRPTPAKAYPLVATSVSDQEAKKIYPPRLEGVEALHPHRGFGGPSGLFPFGTSLTAQISHSGLRRRIPGAKELSRPSIEASSFRKL
jgi:hypothetical protein